jgi:hypothetical protein
VHFFPPVNGKTIYDSIILSNAADITAGTIDREGRGEKREEMRSIGQN